jgi:nicotinamide-nucleotide amidase
MIAEVICIGTEILLGDIVNTNGAFLARELAALGIDMYHQSVVGDNTQRLKESLKLALSRSDVVLTTGGLGPTYDDLTKKTVADYFGIGMEMHEPSLKKIEALFENIGKTMTPNNLLQAQVPQGSIVFFNDTGFAPGVAVEQDGKIVIMMPGPPSEMCPMFINRISPYLQSKTGGMIRSKTLHIFGMGESQVEDKLRDLMTSSTNPTIAPYAKQGEVQVRVSAKAQSEQEAQALMHPAAAQIQQILGDVVYGVDVGSMQNALVQTLIEKKLVAATAESCTGGLVSAAITDVSGASAVFAGGVCTYTNELKVKLLGVSEDTLASVGAVSPETAEQMARGVRTLTGADIGVGITGIAGPGGGSDDKPVGLVYVAVSSDAHSEVEKLMLSRGHKDERESIRHLAKLNALFMMLTAAKKA